MSARVIAHGGAQATRLRDIGPRPADRALRIGVSGGIGTGKSTLSDVFRARGAVVVDADRLSRRVVEPGTRGLAQVVEAFGGAVLAVDGTLDRAALGRVVFSDPEARARLEGIVHPLVARAAWDTMASAPVDRPAVYDVPLLVETHMEDLFDVVVMVDAPLENRLDRLAARGVAREEAHRRIAAQATREQRRTVATIWVDNAGTRADLQAVVEDVIATWLPSSPAAPAGARASTSRRCGWRESLR